VYRSERFGQQSESLFALSHFPIHLGLQSQEIRLCEFCPGGSPGGQTLVHLRQPFLYLPLFH